VDRPATRALWGEHATAAGSLHSNRTALDHGAVAGADRGISRRRPAYALLGLKTGFDNGGPISAYIEGRNLTNRAYIASTSIINQVTATSTLFEPGNGRAVFAGMKYRW